MALVQVFQGFAHKVKGTSCDGCKPDYLAEVSSYYILVQRHAYRLTPH